MSLPIIATPRRLTAPFGPGVRRTRTGRGLCACRLNGSGRKPWPTLSNSPVLGGFADRMWSPKNPTAGAIINISSGGRPAARSLAYHLSAKAALVTYSGRLTLLELRPTVSAGRRDCRSYLTHIWTVTRSQGHARSGADRHRRSPLGQRQGTWPAQGQARRRRKCRRPIPAGYRRPSSLTDRSARAYAPVTALMTSYANTDSSCRIERKVSPPEENVTDYGK